MRQQLGVLKTIDARQIWEHEARDFTPWLRANIGLLGAALGMDLDVVSSEVRVGPFAADLVAKDVSEDRWVVIENQLEPTDHAHLGQLLTYGAGTSAAVFVWISPEFRDEHRAALDWLNEHSDEHSVFFGVEVELVAIDDSRPAPNFKLVSSPNDWRSGAGGAPGTGASPKEQAYSAFFDRLLTDFKARYPGETSVSKAGKLSWQALSIGRSGLLTVWVFTGDKRFRVELSIDIGDQEANGQFFDRLMDHRADIETQMHHALDWDRVEGRRACRVSSYYPERPVTVLDGEDVLRGILEWASVEMKTMRDVMRPLMRSIAAGGE
jgi:hypothetical protein